MLKDDALRLRERLTPVAVKAAAKAGLADLADDGKLYHDELDGQARWAQRLAASGWPHAAVGAGGRTARPGLRLEVWYGCGKAKPDEELVLLALCADEPALSGLRDRLEPVWAGLLGGGKAAGRYKPLTAAAPLAARLEPGVVGVARRVPVKSEKVEAAVAQLMDDLVKPLLAALAGWDGADAFDATPVDPLDALRERFGSR
jgi:hypothetical protein